MTGAGTGLKNGGGEQATVKKMTVLYDERDTSTENLSSPPTSRTSSGKPSQSGLFSAEGQYDNCNDNGILLKMWLFPLVLGFKKNGLRMCYIINRNRNVE